MNKTHTVTEIASAMGISKTRVHQLIKDKVLVVSKVGNQYVATTEDVISAINQKKPRGRPRKNYGGAT